VAGGGSIEPEEHDDSVNTETSQFTLELTPRGNWKHQLFPEQNPDFDLVLRNAGSSTVNALPLYGSFQSPRIALYQASGASIGAYTKADMYARQVGDPSEERPDPPQLEDMAPGKGSQISVAVWDYRVPLPPGSYTVLAEHRTEPGGAYIQSNRYSFEVVRASVKTVSMGYNSAGHLASILAWLDAGASGVEGSERLLVRLSAMKGHSSLMVGATSHGEYPAGSLVSVGQVSIGTKEGPLNWLGVLSGSHATAIRHNMTGPFWRSEPVALAIGGGVPVPRFPSMGPQMLFLATGTDSKGAALAGALFEQPKGLLGQWSVPLAEKPSMTACLARAKRPAALLLATNHQGGSRISRLDVSVDGKPIGSEKLIRQSKNTVLAVGPAFDPESGDAFFALEGSPEEPDRLALVTIPMSGPLRPAKLQPMPGWPRDENGKAVKPLQTQTEQAVDGSVAVAFVDSRGFFYGGKMLPKPFVGRLRAKADSPCIFPHIAALSQNLTPACFTSEGMLFTPGAEPPE
jgi:hypothetical protein